MNSLGKALVLILVTCFARSAFAAVNVDYVAFSLREASLRASRNDNDSNLHCLSGITRIAGAVYDNSLGDFILVGLRDEHLPAASLDDLIVAIRARINYGEWPLVSIDPTPETAQTRKQKVTFDGHLDRTAFGRDFLASDVVLKKSCLGQLEELPVVPSFVHFIENEVIENAKQRGQIVESSHWNRSTTQAERAPAEIGTPVKSAELFQAKFWFTSPEAVIAMTNDVFCIKELKLVVDSRYFPADGRALASNSAQQEFAARWTAKFDDMAQKHPVLLRLKLLYDLVATAEALRVIENRTPFEFLLREYKLPDVQIEKSYPLKELTGEFQLSNGAREIVQVAGGIQAAPQISLLNVGIVKPLRDLVLTNRPSSHALSWPLPLAGWAAPNARDIVPTGRRNTSVLSGTRTPGCAINFQSYLFDPKAQSSGALFSGFQAPFATQPSRGVSMRLTLNNDSFQRVTGDALSALEKTALNSKPSPGSMSWPISPLKNAPARKN